MEISTILYLIEVPLNERDYHRFGISYFSQAKKNIIILDISSYLYPFLHYNWIPPDIRCDERIIIVNTKDQIRTELRKLSPYTLVISHCPYNARTDWIFRELHTLKCKIILPLVNPIPKPEFENQGNEGFSSLMIRMKKVFFNIVKGFRKDGQDYGMFLLTSLLQTLSSYIPIFSGFYQFHIPYVDYVFISTKKTLDLYPSPLIDSRTVKKFLHSYDYDLFLESAKTSPVKEKYSVFLDEYYPYHPDSQIHDETPDVTPEQYFSSLNAFFDEIEKRYSHQVIIALHPRAETETYSVNFDGRQCFQGITQELIRECEFVIIHASTAISFAVLYNKPIMFITTKEIIKTRRNEVINTYSQLFETSVVNIDSYPLHLSITDHQNVKCYQSYKDGFIKEPGTQDRFFWDQVASILEDESEEKT